MKLKKTVLMTVLVGATAAQAAGNPFFEKFNTPHGTYPFDAIRTEHYMPAFEEGMRQHDAEIEAIVNNPQAPTFANTILAYEKSGRLLSVVAGAFYNLTSADTNDELQAIAQELSPKMSDHGNAIRLNEKLFARIKAVYDQKDKLKLTAEQKMLLEKIYDGFATNGANLSEADKAKYRAMSKKLSQLSLNYGQNILKETNQWTMLLTDEKLLAGLPENVKNMMAENAAKRGKKGWLLDLKPTTTIPFMQYADNRDLRHELWMANSTRCMNGGEYDNRQNVIDIANTRLEMAKILGSKSYADHTLQHRMAENKDNVYNLLDQLHAAYMPTARHEYEELQQYANEHGFYTTLQPWDWAYYSEKLKEEKYALNDEVLRPYFELENVKKGVFGLATKLYGIHFTKNPNIQVYNPEVEAFDVTDSKGKFIAVLYTDFHPRDSKRGGAWMNDFKGQWKDGKTDSRPHIVIVMNFTRPTADKPALLTLSEVETFLHEFGHSLHGMLTKCTYETLSGTNVYRDFVELPSQIMENWAIEKEFLDGFAVHYQTGEKIPAELIAKIKEASNYHAAYSCIRQLSFGYLDMAWHTIETPFSGNPITFEKDAMASTQVLPVQMNTAMSTSFSHIFSGGYAAGYYGYKWAEVLDADAFSVFKKNGIFDKKTADSFRTNILERGGTEEPMTLYKRFRGQAPTIDALLERNGLK